jgi:hypothetical protein
LDPQPWRENIVTAAGAKLAESLAARHSSELDEEQARGASDNP